MVSFSCEVCNDTVKKNKLDQHAQRCRGAYFTCIDCSTTFNGTEYRSHTQCISEAEKYEKALYKGKKQEHKDQKQKEAKEVKGAKKEKKETNDKNEKKEKKEMNNKNDKKKKNEKEHSKSLADASKLTDGSLYKVVKAISKESKLDRKQVMERLQVTVADGKLVITL